jgi:hypothetical protein
MLLTDSSFEDALADSVTEDKMPKSAFKDIFAAALINAGYLYGASIHSIRLQLGKKIDGKLPSAQRCTRWLLRSSYGSHSHRPLANSGDAGKFTAVQRSQHLTQSDPSVFG